MCTSQYCRMYQLTTEMKSYIHNSQFTLGCSKEVRQFCPIPLCSEHVSVTVNSVRWAEREEWEKKKVTAYVALFTRTSHKMGVYPKSQTPHGKEWSYLAYFSLMFYGTFPRFNTYKSLQDQDLCYPPWFHYLLFCIQGHVWDSSNLRLLPHTDACHSNVGEDLLCPRRIRSVPHREA